MPVAGEPDNKLAIVTTNPVGGTYGVPAGISEITVTFNEPIYYDPTTSEHVQIFSYPVGQSETELPIGVISVRDGNTLVISAPQTPWLTGYMYYKVHIIRVRGMDGDWMPGGYYYDFNFKTASTDPAPTVVSTYPAADESNIPADVTITAIMNEEINICVGTVQMLDSKNNPVALLYSDQYFQSADHIHLEIKPVAPLILGEKYTVTIQGLDHQDIVMEKPFSWSFSTATSPPTTEISFSGDGPHCGWYKTDVVVTLTATDHSGSGIEKTQYSYDNGATWTDYTEPFTITSEGITNVAYRSIDNAGYTGATQNTDVKIDKTPPTIVAEIIETVDPVNDWYPSSVKVKFTAVDDISYIRTDPAGGSGHFFITYENLCADGKDQMATVTVEDGPGNTATATLTVSIDKTPPSTEIILTGVKSCGWYKTDVVVTLTATDGTGSGIDKTQYSYDNGATWTDYTEPFTLTSEGITNVVYRSIDKAGHTEATQNTDVKIDKTPPTIEAAIIETAPPLNDWYHSSVKVRFTAVDAISLIRTDPAGAPGHVYTEDKSHCNEGKDQPISLTLEDGPGNEATATITVSIDKTPPTITINFPVNCAHYIVNEDIHADWTTSDSLSGIATQSGTVPTGSAIDTATIGSKQFTVTATDMAGNQNTKTVSYTVDSQADATKETITTVESLEVLPRIKTTLKAELNGAVTALTNDRPRIAKVILRAVNLEVKVMSGKQIPADQAATLIAQIQRIINTI